MTVPTELELNKMLDLVKTNVFLGSNAAFLGSILCSVEFKWDLEKPDIVWTDGINMGWGPKDFLRCSPKERTSTLLHELWHVALMHGIRQGNRDPKVWNIACDYRINNNLRADKYEVPNNWVVDPKLDRNGILSEEEIYDLLMQNAIPMPVQAMPDLKPQENPDPNAILSTVVRAAQAAKLAGQAGTLPGSIQELLTKFLEPVIPWRNVLAKWMTELMDTDEYTWRRRNRRYEHIYMPGTDQEEGKLQHLVYFLDVSGSITEEDCIRFNSEVKFVQETINPEKLTLVQFDTRITHTQVFTSDEPFEDIQIVGGGGTSLVPVRNWIEEKMPTAAIIFSDLECPPMSPLTKNIPIIWAVIRNKNVKVPFGTLIHIED